MNRVQRTLFRVVGRTTTGVYRASNGRLMNKATGGSPVLLLTVAGRRSSTAHTVPVAYFPLGDGWVVVGSAGGDAAEPQWFRNLRATDQAVAELGDQRHDVSVRILDGVERDAAFTGVVAAASSFAAYETKAGRPMPLALLSPR